MLAGCQTLSDLAIRYHRRRTRISHPVTVRKGTNMKNLLGIVLVFCVVLPASADDPPDSVIRLSDPVEVTDTHEVFGSPVGEIGEVMPLADVIARESEFLDRQVAVNARVAKVCQKKGCFFVAQDGDAVARVTFVDYSFFVPTDSGGKDVTIIGTLGKATLSEEKARHYARDEGTDPGAVEGPRTEYSIVARSVVVPRT